MHYLILSHNPFWIDIYTSTFIQIMMQGLNKKNRIISLKYRATFLKNTFLYV